MEHGIQNWLSVVILSAAKYLKIKRDISPLAQYDKKNAVIASKNE